MDRQALEAQHASHTMDELEEAIAAGRLQDFPAFEKAANEMLDACAVFWEVGDAPEIQWRFVQGALSGIRAEMRSERRVCAWRNLIKAHRKADRPYRDRLAP